MCTERNGELAVELPELEAVCVCFAAMLTPAFAGFDNAVPDRLVKVTTAIEGTRRAVENGQVVMLTAIE